MKKKTTQYTLIKQLSIIASVILIILVSWWIIDQIFIILAYGTDAYFVNHLRVEDSKHGILSNGQEIPIHLEILRMASTYLLILIILVNILTIVGTDILKIFEDDSKIHHEDHKGMKK